ncbi:hypothetical protein [Liquorilactobacillus uvarum]|uniref:Uncharacterized protein n=1 Tax=Liquorilactobacillus uvarum DSM 19971 TaxID=1423812 RepID=A0A0R1Q1F9_9LACO|nr:hypothetical protein [Liquorilactobacillus uvarum]KRL38527.1 hypothetical protein FD20_GL001732 [Liquorilactobacillus uvarum DSM 19971]
MIKLCEQRIDEQELVEPHIFSSVGGMWQRLVLPSKYKNGRNILLEENFYLLEEGVLKTDRIVLNFIRKYRTSKGKKIIELSLDLYYKNKITARLQLTMMTEVEWNEDLFKNYRQDG